MTPDEIVGKLVKQISSEPVVDGRQSDGSYVWTFKVEPKKPDVYSCTFTKVTQVSTFMPTGDVLEDMRAAHKKISEEELNRVKELMAEKLREAEDAIWEQFSTGCTPKPTQPSLYSENYRSAVVDKSGKVIKRID